MHQVNIKKGEKTQYHLKFEKHKLHKAVFQCAHYTLFSHIKGLARTGAEGTKIIYLFRDKLHLKVNIYIYVLTDASI